MTSPAVTFTAAVVAAIGGVILGWHLRGGAGPIGTARKRPSGAVRTPRTFQPTPELLQAMREGLSA